MITRRARPRRSPPRATLDRFDVAEIGAGAAEIGNPAGAVVKALKAADRRAGAPRRDEPGRRRHRGDARHQARARAAARRPARRRRRRGASSRKTHRDTPIIGRTLLQQALPTTFGLKAAGWMVGLDEAAGGPRPASRLAGAARRPGRARSAAALPRGLAADLGLDAPLLPWHTLRGRIGELAGALGVAAGAIGKAARDVTLLAQTEVGEVREAAPRRLDARCRTSTTRSPRSPRSAARSRRPASSPRCSPRWCRSTSAPPAPGTASGAR